jgi:outer membrane receptor for ferrienterochelin and colicin
MKNKLVIASIFLPITVSAATELDIFDLSLQELTKITIASKQQQTVYNSPSSVSVISRSQIKNMGIKNLQSLLNFIPGFQSTRDIEQGTANRIHGKIIIN